MGAQRTQVQGDIHPAVLIQYKTVLREIRSESMGVALAVGGQANERGAGYYANVPLSWVSASESTLLHLNLGLSSAPGGERPSRPWGIAAEQRLTPSIWVIGERFQFSSQQRLLQGGLRWWLVEDSVQVDATIGRQSTPLADQRLVSVGVRWIFRAPFAR
jgi:hypothetical protein